jgi:hypothetical protein
MLVDSKKQMLVVEDLMRIAAEMANEGVPMELVLAAFVREAQMPDSKFFRYGNTIFIVHGSEEVPGTGIFRAINADTPQNYIENSRKWIVDAYNSGYWALRTQFKDQSLINLFTILAKNPPRPNMGYQIGESDDGQFIGTLILGPRTPVQGE